MPRLAEIISNPSERSLVTLLLGAHFDHLDVIDSFKDHAFWLSIQDSEVAA